MVFRVPRKPTLDGRCFVRGIVVHNQVHLGHWSLGNRLIDMLEESQELLMTMPLMATPDYFACLGVQGGEQGCRTVPCVVVCLAFDLPWLHGQKRLGSVKCLHLALFVDAIGS